MQRDELAQDTATGSESPPARPYHSPLRAAQARATRLAILRAARRLIVEDGYVSTTMAAVARAAGVAPNTVKLNFPTKRDLLMGVWDFALKGEDSQVPAADSSDYRDMLAEPDPRRKLAKVAHNTRLVRDRAADVFRAMTAAADADPEIRAQRKRMAGEFWNNQNGIVRSLADRDALRPELDITAATDVLVALNNGALYTALVTERDWDGERFETWHTELLQHALLAPDRSSD